MEPDEVRHLVWTMLDTILGSEARKMVQYTFAPEYWERYYIENQVAELFAAIQSGKRIRRKRAYPHWEVY